MFQYIKYISAVALTFIFILITVSFLFIKNRAILHVIDTGVTKQASFIADVYTSEVWNKFYPVITYLYNYEPQKWINYPQFYSFSQESLRLLNYTGMFKVAIYDGKGNVLVQTRTDSPVSTSSLLSKLLNDKNSSLQTYMSNGEIIHVFKKSVPLAVTKINPAFIDDVQKAKGSLEVSYDVSDIIREVNYLGIILISIIALVIALLAMGLFFIIGKTEIIIDKHQEESLELAMAKAEAEKENDNKSKFLANISHELRTPLNAIIGFSEIMVAESMGPLGTQQYKDFIKDIHLSGVHLLSLINDILDYSKAQANKLELIAEDIDLSKLMLICIRMIMPRAEEAKVKVSDSLPKEHLVVSADPKRVKQVLLNILSNSVKFTPENGEITIKAWLDPEKQEVIIQIKDTGVGISPHDIARAMSPFGQIDNKLSKKYEGTGLGLPLTKKLLELMHGKFDIKSELGLGTLVTISLPTLPIAGSVQPVK